MIEVKNINHRTRIENILVVIPVWNEEAIIIDGIPSLYREG
jgi:hypothetical protein